MEYTIGEISEMTGLTISTLRYYEKEGLLSGVKRQSGIRKYTDKDINTLRIIECLKYSGLQLEDIKNYMILCKRGDKSLKERLDIFLETEQRVKKQIESLNRTLDMIQFKKWYYTTAIKNNSERSVRDISYDEMPDEIKELYSKTHSGFINEKVQ